MGGSTLIGRTRELDALEEALTTALAGELQIVLVEGEAGVGKSSLLRAFRDDHEDVNTLAWAGDETETQLSFAMLDQLVGVDRSWVDPFTAGAALLTQLGELAIAGPVLLALDDAHLADPQSLVAVNFALRRLRHDPVVALLSARPRHVGELPPSILRMATASERRLVLGGLTVRGVQQLAGTVGAATISRRAAERLHSVTNGNPLHLKALLAEVPTEELEQLDRPIPAPRSFAQLVLSDLESASTAARTVARAAAVLGDRCEIADLRAVAGLDDDAGLRTLDELARLRVLSMRPGSSTVVFEHPLVRAAVYGDVGPAARADLHRAAADVLEGWPSLRHRIAAAFRTDPGLAADLESWSEHQREHGNPPAAAEAMLAAYRLTPAGRDADRRLLAAVRLFTIAGDARAAQAHAAGIAALPVSGLRLAVQARVAWLTGRFDDAVVLGRQAWGRSDLDPAERDLIASTIAKVEIMRDHADEAVTWATRALADGRLDPTLASHTRTHLVLGLATGGRYDEALAGLADLPEEPEDVETGRHPELSVRGALAAWEGLTTTAQRDLAVAAAWTHGDMQPFRLEAAATLGVSLFRSGHWDRSQATLLQTLALAQDMEQTWMLGCVSSQCAAVPAARGDWTQAQEYVANALRYAEHSGDLATAAYADDAAALLAMARAEPEAVVRATERIRHAPDTSPQRDPGIFSWPVHLVAALIELGQLDEAEAELARVLRRARPDGQRTAAARLRVAGQLAAARHHVGRARECFTRALAVADDRVDALERALAHEAYGRFLRRRGERRSAIHELRQARAHYQALAALPFADRCDRELAACGVDDPEAVTATDPLTPQERAVARLICSGRTNRQAAQELVLSVKTIGYHLANVYAKLGVHSRAQLFAAMRDQQSLAQTAQWSPQPSNLRQGGRVQKPDAVKDERAGDRRAKRR